MDVVFLHSKELNWQENFERAKNVIGSNIILVDGSGAKSIKNAYEIMLDNVKTDFFMMIEADNFVHDIVRDYLNVEEELKFWTINKFGIAYEHGGIKIMNKLNCNEHLKTNAFIHPNFEVSANLALLSKDIVLSEHRFDWSPKNEWTTIAKELIKIYYWSHEHNFKMWIEHEVPRNIFNQIQPLLEKIGFTDLFETLLPSLGKYYDENINGKF